MLGRRDGFILHHRLHFLKVADVYFLPFVRDGLPIFCIPRIHAKFFLKFFVFTS